MRNLRCYYSASIEQFLCQSNAEILGIIHENNISADTTIQQANTWEEEISILKDQLASFTDGRVLFEYTIPRMGKRVDAVVIVQNIVFLLEFKCGDTAYRSATYDQSFSDWNVYVTPQLNDTEYRIYMGEYDCFPAYL